MFDPGKFGHSTSVDNKWLPMKPWTGWVYEGFPAYRPQPSTAEETYAAADALMQRGLRAQLSDTQLLGGDAIVTLNIKADAGPAHLGRAGRSPNCPPARRHAR